MYSEITTSSKPYRPTGIVGNLPYFGNLRQIYLLYLNSNSITGTISRDFLAKHTHHDDHVLVNLSNNLLMGDVLSTLYRCENMNLYLGENDFDHLDYHIYLRSDLMDFRVRQYGCDAFL